MKLILSRKGFDSTSGGMASPILPDGTLLSLPIPSEDGTIGYDEIFYGDKSYLEIISELNPAIGKKLMDKKCHLDPDIQNRYRESVTEWKPAFGQADLTEKHLKKQEVSKEDIFLFYGWFRKTEYKDGKLRFVRKRNSKESVDLHVIWGYLQVEEKVTDKEIIMGKYPFHPHAQKKYLAGDNALYIPSDLLSIDTELNGYGVLKYRKDRVLTKDGHNRAEWELPDCFRDIYISYHDTPNYGWIDGNDYFKSAYRGQEFVLEMNERVLSWVREIVGDENEKISI